MKTIAAISTPAGAGGISIVKISGEDALNIVKKIFKTNNIGSIIVTVVLCAPLVYEIVGPLLTKWCLNKTGEIPNEDSTYPYELVSAE